MERRQIKYLNRLTFANFILILLLSIKKGEMMKVSNFNKIITIATFVGSLIADNSLIISIGFGLTVLITSIVVDKFSHNHKH